MDAYKTPVITSLNGGSSTLIEGRNTGQIVETFDVDKWVAAIFKYVDNPIFRETTTSKAYKLVRDEFNWKVLAQKMLDTYYEKNN